MASEEIYTVTIESSAERPLATLLEALLKHTYEAQSQQTSADEDE